MVDPDGVAAGHPLAADIAPAWRDRARKRARPRRREPQRLVNDGFQVGELQRAVHGDVALVREVAADLGAHFRPCGRAGEQQVRRGCQRGGGGLAAGDDEDLRGRVHLRERHALLVVAFEDV